MAFKHNDVLLLIIYLLVALSDPSATELRVVCMFVCLNVFWSNDKQEESENFEVIER